MSLRNLAWLNLLGLAFIFSSRMSATFSPEAGSLLSPLAWAGLHFLAGLVQLLFFLALTRDWQPRPARFHTSAARLAVTGSALALLPQLFNLVSILWPAALAPIYQLAALFNLFCPLFGAFLLLVFALIWLLGVAPQAGSSFRFAFFGGVAGWGLLSLFQALVMANFLSGGRVAWLRQVLLSGQEAVIFILGLAFAGLAVFFAGFVRVGRGPGSGTAVGG